MIIVLTSSLAISAYGALYAYYFRSSFLPIRSQIEQNIFFTNTMITGIPIVIYTFILLNTVYYNETEEILIPQFLFIEWTMSTPLILYTIGGISKITLPKQLALSTAAVGINIFGYLAHGAREKETMLLFFLLGSSVFLGILGTLQWIYWKRRTMVDLSSPRYREYTRLIFQVAHSTILLWILYPINFILYKYEFYGINAAYPIFAILDFFSKGGFISCIIHNQEALCLIDSFTNQIFPRRASASARVQPESPVASEKLQIETI
jgi:bacteriorhodopsin